VILVSLRFHPVGAKYHYYPAQNISSSLHTFTDGGATPSGFALRASGSVNQCDDYVQGLVQVGKAREKGPLAAALPNDTPPGIYRSPPQETTNNTVLGAGNNFSSSEVTPSLISAQSSFPTHHQIRDYLNNYNKVNGATYSIDSQPEVKDKSWHGWKFEPNSSPWIGKCIFSVNTCRMATSRAILER
jgi:hypothetical protein